jgi:rhomboid protease GluP
VPGGVAAVQWWRLITPLFVHSGGWRQIGFNFSAIAVVGTLVERLFGPRQWLLLYFAGGIVGELAGGRWEPTGAGASVAGCGLLGALAVWLIARNATVRGRFGGAFILIGAAALTFYRDLHGPPILAGAILAVVMLVSRDSKESGQQ